MTQQPIVIIGAGVIGVMSAQALVARDQRVIVLDRAAGPAQVCSRANAGIIAVGHAQAWAGPDAIGTLIAALAGRAAGVRVTRFGDPALWRWGWRFCAIAPSRVMLPIPTGWGGSQRSAAISCATLRAI
jgi:D-amino-acid dehydrogenase